jgi:hypothetical protein
VYKFSGQLHTPTSGNIDERIGMEHEGRRPLKPGLVLLGLPTRFMDTRDHGGSCFWVVRAFGWLLASTGVQFYHMDFSSTSSMSDGDLCLYIKPWPAGECRRLSNCSIFSLGFTLVLCHNCRHLATWGGFTKHPLRVATRGVYLAANLCIAGGVYSPFP